MGIIKKGFICEKKFSFYEKHEKKMIVNRHKTHCQYGGFSLLITIATLFFYIKEKLESLVWP